MSTTASKPKGKYHTRRVVALLISGFIGSFVLQFMFVFQYVGNIFPIFNMINFNMIVNSIYTASIILSIFYIITPSSIHEKPSNRTDQQ